MRPGFEDDFANEPPENLQALLLRPASIIIVPECRQPFIHAGMRRFSFTAAAAWAGKFPHDFPIKKGRQQCFSLRPKTRKNASLLRRGLRECVQSAEAFGVRQCHHALLLRERRGQHAQFEKSRAAPRTGMNRLPRGLLTLFYGLSNVCQRREVLFRRCNAQETPLACLYAPGETASHPKALSRKRFAADANG